MDLKKFYKGKNILLTGSTGFLGKVILNKIVSSLSEFNKIYLLVREKKGVSIEERMRKIFDSYSFIHFKRKFVDNESFEQFLKERIILINGDLTIPHLGIPEMQRKDVIENVHILINSAASVKFDDKLKKALEINYFGS